ncbi:MAG: hypothetical protein EHM47_02040 [Ignavibacteriales bacterium]|nr:MAG: hypothetical protein EHM47_02040 [Ignavibacteriales bacterium]
MEEKKINLIDYFVLIVKKKKFFITVGIITAVLTYLLVFFLIEEQFDASATIIPIEESSLGGISSFLKDLPVEIPGGGFSNSEMNIYNTIIYSRNLLEKVIAKFDLIDIYEIDKTDPEYMEKTLKELRGNIFAEETDDNAYAISVRANEPQLASDITNYIIQLLNTRIVELKISKSSQNRIFLEERLTEVRYNLKKAEDSLLLYQNKSGMLNVEDQVKGILEAYSKLETELITKQIEKSILEELMPKDSPQLQSVEVQVAQFEKKLSEIKKQGQPNSILLSMENIPNKAINYLRLLREVEINNAILEFVMPLYEQARFEEHKDIPVLQVVDYAIPPVKKSYPPRTIFTLLVTFGVLLLGFFILLIKENDEFQKSEEIKYIKRNLFRWRKID